MYSVVLMMALSGGAENPAWFGRCNGCSSCGCSSSCSSSCHGCHGGRKSCHGGLFGGRRCHGCSSCNGCSSCHGGSACHGCHGASYCHGCSGSSGCCGGAVHAPPPPPKTGGTKEKIDKPKSDKEEAFSPAPATILVSLPADAKLTIDGAATKATSTTRLFASPELEPGKEFHYTLKAEIVRDGKTVTASKRVAVRAGEETKVELEFPVAAVAQR